MERETRPSLPSVVARWLGTPHPTSHRLTGSVLGLACRVCPLPLMCVVCTSADRCCGGADVRCRSVGCYLLFDAAHAHALAGPHAHLSRSAPPRVDSTPAPREMRLENSRDKTKSKKSKYFIQTCTHFDDCAPPRTQTAPHVRTPHVCMCMRNTGQVMG